MAVPSKLLFPALAVEPLIPKLQLCEPVTAVLVQPVGRAAALKYSCSRATCEVAVNKKEVRVKSRSSFLIGFVIRLLKSKLQTQNNEKLLLRCSKNSWNW